MQAFLQVIKEVAVFMVLCEILMHFTPSVKYEKYMKPVIGFMIASKILISIISFAQEDVTEEWSSTITKYQQQMDSLEGVYHQDYFTDDTVDVTEELSKKLNNDIISKYRITKAQIKAKENEDNMIESYLVVYVENINSSIEVEKIILNQEEPEESAEIKSIIAQKLDMNPTYIRIVKES